MRKTLLGIISLTALSTQVVSYEGTIAFSSNEIIYHERSIGHLLEISKNCLQNYKYDHLEFYKNNCYTKSNGSRVCLSKYFGERKYSKEIGAVRADGEKLEYLGDALRNSGFSPDFMNTMETTSCVGMALSCLKKGFDGTGQSAQWNRIMTFVRKNQVGGTALQHALQKIGWRLYYWNPEPLHKIFTETQKWDLQEADWKSKGWHHYRYITVMNHNKYWYNHIDDKHSMVGFENGTPYILYSVPFWVATANTGYHVFPGTYTEVIEAHSTRHITAKDNIEFSTFAPFATGGGPRWTRTEKYRSGMMALPPGY